VLCIAAAGCAPLPPAGADSGESSVAGEVKQVTCKTPGSFQGVVVQAASSELAACYRALSFTSVKIRSKASGHQPTAVADKQNGEESNFFEIDSLAAGPSTVSVTLPGRTTELTTSIDVACFQGQLYSSSRNLTLLVSADETTLTAQLSSPLSDIFMTEFYGWWDSAQTVQDCNPLY